MYENEIERKFLIDSIPNYVKIKEKRYINQYYISNISNNDLDKRVYSVNFENNSVKYFYSIKKGKGLVRKEIEKEISSNLFFKIINRHKSIPIIKIRKFIEINNNLIAEIDEFINYPLTLVEVEFKNIIDANNFIIPSWFKKEKTNNLCYTNKYIWNELQKNRNENKIERIGI